MRSWMVALFICSLVVGMASLGLNLAIRFWNRSIPARPRVWVWMLLGAALFAPISLLTPKAPVTVELSAPAVVVPAPFEDSARPGAQQPEAAYGQEENSPLPVRYGYRLQVFAVCAVVWAAGTGGVLLLEALRHMHWRNKIWRWRQKLDNQQQKHWIQQLMREAGCKRKLRVFTAPGLQSPLVTGGPSPALLLPEGFFTRDGAEMVLRHELNHLKARDPEKKTLLFAACALHWFNPLIWEMAARAHRDIELACDEQVVKDADLAYRMEYNRVLLAYAARSRKDSRPAFSTSFAEDKNSLKERFQAVLDTGSKRRGYLAPALAVLCVVAALNLVRVQPARRGEVGLQLPDSGATLLIRMEDGRVLDTPVAVTQNWAEFPEELDNRAAAANVGEFFSVASIDLGIGTGKVSLVTTRNNGKRWEKTTLDIGAHMDMVLGLHHGYVSKEEGYLFLYGAKDKSSNRGVFLYRTLDGGKNWTVMPYLPSPRAWLTGAGFIDEKTGFLVFDILEGKPVLLKTCDGGNHWFQAGSVFPETAGGLRCIGAKFVGGITLHCREEINGQDYTLYSEEGDSWQIVRQDG